MKKIRKRYAKKGLSLKISERILNKANQTIGKKTRVR